MGLLDGKVAIVTGAGGGLGRAHALLFASEGAKVVVNDLGGSRDGGGGSSSLADQVVEEIRAAGGEAAANYDSVASFDGAQAIIQTALDNFGQVDILVNNAGILRDKSMMKMTEGMYDLVHAVHMKGTWNCSHHAAKAMAEAGNGGRIINTTSIAGLKGNFGQTNYGSAKAGIWGLTLTCAIELKKHRITCNAIGPMAKTRMTEDIDMVPDDMKPELISPVLLWLASDLAETVTGRTFGVHGQQIFEYHMEMTPGVEKEGAEPWTPDEIQAKLADIERPAIPDGYVPAGSAAAGAAPRAVTDADIVAALVEDAPKYFRAEKASGVTSTFHLHVKGADPHSIIVADGACRTVKGHEGTAKRNIKTDAASYIAMARGKMNPQKAFMEGKITADNLGEAMKYASLFRQPKPEDVDARIEALKAAAGGGGGAAPAAMTPAQQVAAIFDNMPKVFVADKAKGWSAAILWKVDGAGEFTIEVKDGACTSKAGAPDKATCTVKLSSATMIGMVTGKVNPQKAFMEGKITADNLGDMMKFGGAFDMKKGRALAEQAAAQAAPAAAAATKKELTPKEICTQAFARMPEIFVPDKAKGWKASILWKVDGGGDWTVNVADGACTIAEGAPEKATCTVKLKADTFIGMLSGKVNPQKAFMEGKITADNLGDMMKFGGAFDMKKGAAMAKAEAAKQSAAAAAGGEEKPQRVGLNKDCIGKVYSGGAHFARPDDLGAYARATNDENPHYLGEAEPHVAPPIFPVRLMKQAMFAAFTDAELNVDLLRLVHGEQDMRFHRPLQPWDLVTVRAKVAKIEDKHSGQVLSIDMPCYVEGELVCEARTAVFIKVGGTGKKKEKKAAEPNEGAEEREVVFTANMSVADDQPKRYAAASLDDNPIHLDPNVAKAAGLPGCILHGLCTMAFASQAVVQEACGGDPTRLKRIAVRFSKPVFPGDTLTTSGWKVDAAEGAETFGFETVNADGTTVITNGLAEVAAV